MALLDACVIGIALGHLDVAGYIDAKHVRQAQLLAARAGAIVAAGFEGGQQSTAGVAVLAQLAALGIGEQSHVGQDHGGVLLQRLWIEIVFVHEVEQVPALQQGVIHALEEVAGGATAGRPVTS